MSSSLVDPFPHAAAYTSFGSPVTLTPPARGLLLSNFTAGADSITIQTVSGESIVIPLGTLTVAQAPIYLPIQTAVISAVTGVATVVALWH